MKTTIKIATGIARKVTIAIRDARLFARGANRIGAVVFAAVMRLRFAMKVVMKRFIYAVLLSVLLPAAHAEDEYTGLMLSVGGGLTIVKTRYLDANENSRTDREVAPGVRFGLFTRPHADFALGVEWAQDVFNLEREGFGSGVARTAIGATLRVFSPERWPGKFITFHREIAGSVSADDLEIKRVTVVSVGGEIRRAGRSHFLEFGAPINVDGDAGLEFRYTAGVYLDR